MKPVSYIQITASLLITLSLSGCNDSHIKITEAKDFYGIWEQKGYGNVWLIDSSGAQTFEYTRETCILSRTIDNTDLNKQLIDKELSTDKKSFSALPMPSAVFRQHFDLRTELPTKCQNGQLTTIATPTFQFEHLWHNFNDYYAFFTERNVDWQQQYTIYRSMVNDGMSQEELANVLVPMLSPIDDSHITLTASGNEFSPGQPSQFVTDLQSAFQQQSEISTFEEFESRELFKIGQVQATYISDVKQAGGPDNRVISWGKIDGNIGFLQINRMVSIDSDPISRTSDFDFEFVKKDLIAIEDIMKEVVNDLESVDALVIDVRENGGGLDNVAMTIANHFARESNLAASKYTENWQGKSRNFDAYLAPTKQQLQVPIAILTSGDTGSAAEVFTIAMRSIPEVTVVGERSEGILSVTLQKSLLNSMKFDLSNEVFLDHQGQGFEAIGIPTDITTTAYDLDGFSNGKDTALEEAIEHLKTQI